MIPTKVTHLKRSKKPLRGQCSMMRPVTCLRAGTVVETFYKQSVPCVHSKEDGVAYRTDIYMLFNQQRLDRMTLEQFSDYMQNNIPPSSPINDLRKKMSDSQLHQYVKSRYIQSPSELMAWSEYLSYEFEKGIVPVDPGSSDPGSSDPAPTPASSQE